MKTSPLPLQRFRGALMNTSRRRLSGVWLVPCALGAALFAPGCDPSCQVLQMCPYEDDGSDDMAGAAGAMPTGGGGKNSGDGGGGAASGGISSGGGGSSPEGGSAGSSGGSSGDSGGTAGFGGSDPCWSGLCSHECSCASDEGWCTGEGLCVACTSHRDQCPGEAGCDVLTGECLPRGNVWHVDEDGGPGTFPTIMEALTQISFGEAGTIIVHQSDAGQTTGNVNISGPRTVAIVAAPGESPILNGGLSTTVAVANGATLFIDGWEVRGAQGISVDDSTVVLDRAVVVGGLELKAGSNVLVRNSIATGVGVAAGATVDVVYSTLVGRFGPWSATVDCSDAGPAAVTIRNSLLLALDEVPDPISPACDQAIRYSASQESLGGTTNTILGDVDAASLFIDLDGVDYRLKNPPASLLTAARWQDADPPTDIDGNARPAVDGTPDVAGAHVPQPLQ